MLWRVQDILEGMAQPLGMMPPVCGPDVARAVEAFNRAQEILMGRNDWPGAEADVCFTTEDCRLTLPARFATITALRIDGAPARLLPDGWQYLEHGPGPLDMHDPAGLCQFEGDHFPTFRDLPAPLPIACFSSEDEGSNATLRIHGFSPNGSELRGSNGVPGLSIPIRQGSPDAAPAMTGQPVSHLSALVKPVTKGEIEVFAVDAATGSLHWLTRMGRHETAPALTRYVVTGARPGVPIVIRARCSLRFHPQYALDDIALIQNREAMRLMAHALRAFDNEDTAKASEYQARAVKVLKDMTAKRENGHAKGINVRTPTLRRQTFIR